MKGKRGKGTKRENRLVEGAPKERQKRKQSGTVVKEHLSRQEKTGEGRKEKEKKVKNRRGGTRWFWRHFGCLIQRLICECVLLSTEGVGKEEKANETCDV